MASRQIHITRVDFAGADARDTENTVVNVRTTPEMGDVQLCFTAETLGQLEVALRRLRELRDSGFYLARSKTDSSGIN